MDVVRNQPIKTACELDANPIQDLTFHWTIFSPWTNSDINFNIVEDTGKLDLDWAIKQYLQQSNNILAGDAHNESHTTLLLQCRGENIAGRQQTPCSYLLRIQNGNCLSFFSANIFLFVLFSLSFLNKTQKPKQIVFVVLDL